MFEVDNESRRITSLAGEDKEREQALDKAESI